MNRNLFALLALIATVGLPTQALAHAVETNYILNGPGLEFQSAFSTGEPLEAATVEIYAPNNPNEPWAELTTNDQGRFAFTPDATIPGDWEVVIQKEGHGDIWTVPVDETGIEADKISDGSRSDVHYATSPLLAAGSGVLAVISAGAAWRLRQRQTAG